MPVKDREIEVKVADDTEDWLNDVSFFAKPPPRREPARQRRAVISIDKVLEEVNLKKRKLRSKSIGKGEKGSKKGFEVGQESSDSSESETEEKTAAIAAKVEDVKQQVLKGDGRVVQAGNMWGRSLFGCRKEVPAPPSVVVGSGVLGRLLQHVRGEDPLKLLLRNQVLIAAVVNGHLDEATYWWAFHHMAFSADQFVQDSACQLLCQLATLRTSESTFECWKPNGQLFLGTLQCLGYVEGDEEGVEDASKAGGIEGVTNLRPLLQYLGTCFKAPAFANICVADAESLVVFLVGCISDRQLQCYLHLVHVCLEALMDYFKPTDWTSAVQNVAARLANGGVSNLLFVKGYLSSHPRITQLKKRMAFLQLSRYGGGNICTPAMVASIFDEETLGEGDSFFDLYQKLVLADLVMWGNPLSEPEDQDAMERWLSFLRRCSCRIRCSDERFYATKVRNWAAFLVQQKYSRMHTVNEVEEEMDV